MEELTPREHQVLALIGEGKGSKEIAFRLGMAHRTARCHRWRIMNKFAVHNTAELMRAAVQNGLLNLAGEPRTPESSAMHGTTRLFTRLDAIIEENRQWRKTLCETLASSQAACKRAEDYREQLKKTVEATNAISVSLKRAINREINAHEFDMRNRASSATGAAAECIARDVEGASTLLLVPAPDSPKMANVRELRKE